MLSNKQKTYIVYYSVHKGENSVLQISSLNLPLLILFIFCLDEVKKSKKQ